MRSIPLLLVLISTISRIKCEESKESKDANKDGVKYAGPIVYSNEKPPIIVFPTPSNTPLSDTKTGQQNVSFKDTNIEYVPFPYQELPVLIYKSKDNPPIHMVSQSIETEGSGNKSLSNIEKRTGEAANTASTQRGGRALKWSNFKLFNDKPVVVKTQKRGPFDNRGVNYYTTQMLDMNNSSLMSSANSPLSLASAPHVVYSGHPPIHVFPQPIILKEPEFSEMASASEQFHAMKSPVSSNSYEPVSTSKKDSSGNPSSTQFYSYSGTPLGSGNSKSYGFRVKTRGNKQDTDYSSSNNYENYDDTYSPQHSDGSSEGSQSEEKFKPSGHYSNSVNSESSNDRDYDREYDRPFADTYSRDKSRDKYLKYNSANNWLDGWDNSDNSWLSSLFGYNRYPSRPRRPMTLSLSPTNEHLVFATSPTNPMEMENLMNGALMNQHFRHNGWVTGMNPMRPTASAIRPVYSFANLFNYRRPPMPPPPTPYYARFGPSLAPTGSNMAPTVSMKQMGYVPPGLVGLPSMSYPVRIPISPLMMYGMRRPTMSAMGSTADLAFAESTRNTTNNASKKWANIPDDYQMSGSHVQPTYALPSTKTTGAPVQNKPPIIIYQGLRPPVHVYKQPNLTVGHNSEFGNSLMSTFQKMSESQDMSDDQNGEEQTTTHSPYYHFFSTEDSIQSFGNNNYKSGSTLYIGENSAFSPRHSAGDWIPVKQSINGSKETDPNI